MRFVVYAFAVIGFVAVVIPVAEQLWEVGHEVSYRWRKRLARRQPVAVRRWRLALGYRLMRPHIDAVDLWQKQRFADANDGRALGGLMVMRGVRSWRLNPLRGDFET